MHYFISIFSVGKIKMIIPFLKDKYNIIKTLYTLKCHDHEIHI